MPPDPLVLSYQRVHKPVQWKYIWVAIVPVTLGAVFSIAMSTYSIRWAQRREGQVGLFNLPDSALYLNLIVDIPGYIAISMAVLSSLLLVAFVSCGLLPRVLHFALGFIAFLFLISILIITFNDMGAFP